MIEAIKVDNDILNDIVQQYFIAVSGIKEPRIGVFSFQDIEDDFKYSLREYSITHSCKCKPWENKTIDELLELNEIKKVDLDSLVEKVNTYLWETHTDSHLSSSKQKEILIKQIGRFLSSIDYESSDETQKMYSIIDDDDIMEVRKNQYLESVLKAMLKAEVNQVKDNEYLVVNSFFKTYKSYLTYMIGHEFREKKKNLIKIEDVDKQIKALQKYIDKMYANEPCNIHDIRWFIAYLVYDSHQMNILMIHMVLGYKTKEITKLYQQLFCKDKSTGKNNTFLHHTDFLNITENKLFEIIEKKYTMPNNKNNRYAIDKLANKDKTITYKETPFTIHVTRKEVFKDMFIYSSVINLLNTHYSK